jgi:hypothetical protein
LYLEQCNKNFTELLASKDESEKLIKEEALKERNALILKWQDKLDKKVA